MGKIKEMLKANSFIRNLVKRIRIYKAYLADASFFCKNYIEGSRNQARLEYRMMLLVHNLEKGMSIKDRRPFGKQKCLTLISLINEYDDDNYDKMSTAYRMSSSILKQWVLMWNKSDWEKDKDFYFIEGYVKGFPEDNGLKNNICGTRKVVYKKGTSSDYAAMMKSRHSIRSFKAEKLNNDDIADVLELVRMTPTACNRQMCKLYEIESERKKKYLFNIIQGIPGFDYETLTFFAVTYDTSAFVSSGERNQGYFNSGLFTMSLVNAFQYKGIGSCMLQWGNSFKEEQAAKKILGIPESERIASIVAAGYYPEETAVPLSKRKEADEIFRIIKD